MDEDRPVAALVCTMIATVLFLLDAGALGLIAGAVSSARYHA